MNITYLPDQQHFYVQDVRTICEAFIFLFLDQSNDYDEQSLRYAKLCEFGNKPINLKTGRV